FNSSLGFLNACYLASRFAHIQPGTQRVLVATAEIENNGQIPGAPLRGLQTVGAAMLLCTAQGGQSGFGGFVFGYYPQYQTDVRTSASNRQGVATQKINVQPAFEDHCLACIPEVVRHLLQREGLTLDDIAYIFPPQISRHFVAGLARVLGVEEQRCVDVT